MMTKFLPQPVNNQYTHLLMERIIVLPISLVREKIKRSQCSLCAKMGRQ